MRVNFNLFIVPHSEVCRGSNAKLDRDRNPVFVGEFLVIARRNNDWKDYI